MRFVGKALTVTLVVLRVFFALYGIISDCDETFNYWEPLHLLVRNFGKQTWEYSPEYSIRSWSFLIPMAAVLKAINSMFPQRQGALLFYAARVLLALFTALAEISLSKALQRANLYSTSCWYLLFAQVAPGMSHSSISLLPSSFAMNCVSFSIANMMDYWTQNSSKYGFYAVFWISVGALTGWPFILILIAPFLLHVAVAHISSKQFKDLFTFVIRSALIFSAVLGFVVCVDSLAYAKLTIVPLNAVLYNVFNKDESTGPNIFGVEPWTYYVLNLALNFNVLIVLAFCGSILVPIWYAIDIPALQTALNAQKLITFNSPLLLWTAIFMAQPHKEERFMYPVYPLILAIAAAAMEGVVGLMKILISKAIRFKKFARFAQISVIILAGVSISTLSLLRSLSLVQNYSAPLRVYSQIPLSNSTELENVCVGREWYHFPTSFLLGSNQRLRFVKSGFSGILPGDFPERDSLLDSISAIPPHMNNKNLWEADKVVDIDECQFYIDIDQGVDSEAGEMNIFATSDWDLLYCDEFINVDKSHGVARVLYTPKVLMPKLATDVKYFRYCIARRNV